MHKLSPRILFRIGAAVMAITMASPAQASDLRITVTNDQPGGGFSLAPVWFGVQDGTFTTFTPGQTASTQIATLAQFGNTGPLSTLFQSQNVGVDTTLTSGNSIAQFLPGQSNSTTIAVSNPAVDQFLSFAGMVVPSNDFFMGNATPLQIFNPDGSFKGPMTIQIYGSGIWDSDTEQQSLTTALTFIQNQTPGSGTQIANGMVTSLFSEPNAATFLSGILGKETAADYTITSVPASTQLLATIQISSVPEPSTLALLSMGIAVMVVRFRAVRSRVSGRTG